MKNILITGGTGLIGSHLSGELVKLGYQVTVLSRSESTLGSVRSAFWDPNRGMIDHKAVADADVIIHLAGTNVGGRVWTASRKRSIVKSRVDSCRLLFNEVKKADTRKLRLFISASGTGYYGAVTSSHIFSETDPAGNDFLAETCRQWEEAASDFVSLGVRTVIFRNGLTLAENGGFIGRLQLLFKLGFGTSLGKGNQFLPWIHIHDLSRIYIYAVENERISGTYNAAAPNQVTFKEFASQLASSYGHKIWLPSVPSALLKAVLGEMSQVILEGSKVSTEKIEQSGYMFLFPDLRSALDNLIRVQR